MKRIEISIEAIFHTLSHFTGVSQDTYAQLLEVGYTNEQITEAIGSVGSKFSDSFALSLEDAVTRLSLDFESVIDSGRWESDGRCRLSFSYAEVIGESRVVNIDTLSREEIESIEQVARGGHMARVAKSDRVFHTNECQLILMGSPEAPEVCTLFPGVLAPPLPEIGAEVPEFWMNNVFIE